VKFLLINGSPRKGNTYKVLKHIGSALIEHDKVELKLINLSEIKLLQCRGCFTCLAAGGEFCPLKDDRDKLLKHIFWADGVIFSSPVYVMNVTATFKNFVDRFAYICHRPRFFHAHAMVVSTTGALGLKNTLKYMSGVSTIWGFRTVAKLGIKTPPGSTLSDVDIEKIQYNANRFYRRVKDRSYSPPLAIVMQYHAQLAVFTNPDLSTEMPADYKFYTDRLGKPFYIDTRVNPIKTLAGKLLSKLVKMTIK